jgi:hypothetical protein
MDFVLNILLPILMLVSFVSAVLILLRGHILISLTVFAVFVLMVYMFFNPAVLTG